MVRFAVPSLTAEAQKVRRSLFLRKFPDGKTPLTPEVLTTLQQIDCLIEVYDAVIRAEDRSVLGIAKLLTRNDNIMSCNLDYCYIARKLEDLFKLGLLTRTKIDRHWIYSPAGAEDGSAEQIA